VLLKPIDQLLMLLLKATETVPRRYEKVTLLQSQKRLQTYSKESCLFSHKGKI
jgi:hypothetical protein